LVPSARIRQIVQQFAGNPQAVSRALVDAANQAGGKDNVTVVYVEGERFAPDRSTARRQLAARPSDPVRKTEATRERKAREPGRGPLIVLSGLLLVAAIGVIVAAQRGWLPNAWVPTRWLPISSPTPALLSSPGVANEVVGTGESITAALERAQPGAQVIVEPGEYREQLRLKENVRVVSRVPRGATIRLPASASEDEPAVFADGLVAAELAGFRIIGDAATPLGVGLFVRDSGISIVDVEITGATRVAMDIMGASLASVVGCDIHDNPGAALAIRAGGKPRISQNVFTRNSMSERASMPLIIERGAVPHFLKNVFYGISPDALASLNDESRQTLARENWFVGVSQPTRPVAPASGSRRGRP
jgi:PPM family protein phosphatase